MPHLLKDRMIPLAGVKLQIFGHPPSKPCWRSRGLQRSGEFPLFDRYLLRSPPRRLYAARSEIAVEFESIHSCAVVSPWRSEMRQASFEAT